MAVSGMAATVAASAMRAPPTLDALLAARTVWHAGRSAIADLDAEPTGHAALDVLLPQGGWPPRALTELLLPADGIGELSLLLPTLARLTQAGDTVALVAPPYLPYAPAWQSAGVDLAQLQVIDAAPRDALWAFEQCLRSGACAAVLGWPATGDAQALRRLQVAADTGACLGFALRDRRHGANPSPAALRLEAVRDAHGATGWHVRKCRGGPPASRVFLVRDADGAKRIGSCVPDAASITRPTATFVRSIASIRRLPELASMADAHPAMPGPIDAPARHVPPDRGHGRSHRQALLHAGPATAATAEANGAAGHALVQITANGKGIRAQARSHGSPAAAAVLATQPASPAPLLVGPALAATAEANGAAGNASSGFANVDGIRAQARPHMPRPWPRRCHPHDPRTLFD